MVLNLREHIRKLGMGRKWLIFRRSFFSFFIRMQNRIKTLFNAFKYYFYNSWLTNFPSYKVRTLYLTNVLGISIGKHTAIHMGCFFSGNKIAIGSNTVIARSCYFDGRVGFIKIGNNVSMAPECYILSMTHITNSASFEFVAKEVIIENYVWLGARCMVLPGVTAQEGSVLAAGAVVSKTVEAYSVVAGVPAKKIGDRTKGLNYNLSYFPFFNSDIA